MVNIFFSGGMFCGCDIDFDVLQKIMYSEAYKQDAVITFRFNGGERGAVIKKGIVGFEEVKE